MISYRPDLFDRLVSRYTSYPTAAQFIGGFGATEQAEAIDVHFAKQRHSKVM